MTENLPAGMTNVVGYYNGAKWPIQLVISKYNVVLHLPPGQYIQDPEGRNYNDPFFELYVNNKQLSREVSDTPLPIYALPTPPGMNSRPVTGHNPVTATSKFELNKKGVRVPALPKPTIPQPQVADEQRNPVTPMTMEEARRLGLVKRARVVPEDYGDTDTTGRPNNTPPPIKYAIDPTMLKKPAPLPAEALKVESKAGNLPTRTLLVQQLQKSASAPATPESANVFLNKTTATAPANSPIVAGPKKAPVMPRSVVKPPPPEPEPEIEEEVPEESPEPAMQELEESPEVAQVEEGMPKPEVADPAEQEAQEAQEAAPPLKPVTPNNRFLCMACGAPFKFHSQLKKHALQKHKEQADAILAQYPEE